jgi:hypothetical protein
MAVRRSGDRFRQVAVVIAFLVLGATRSEAQSTPTEAVTRLYRDYAWEVVFASPPDGVTGFAQSPRATLIKYVDTSLARLLVADQTCLARGQGICNLDFAPLWGSQDPAVSGFEIGATRDPSIVRVRYTVPGGDQEVTLDLQLVRTPAGWRVRDIFYEGGNSLRGLLSTPRDP